MNSVALRGITPRYFAPFAHAGGRAVAQTIISSRDDRGEIDEDNLKESRYRMRPTEAWWIDGVLSLDWCGTRILDARMSIEDARRWMEFRGIETALRVLGS